MFKKIFSGVQPSGNLHLGNYLGAIKNFVDLQNQKETECIYCIVDLHAITVKQEPKELKKNIRETLATFIASGLDYEKSIIFNQSSVTAHAEGAWILSCIARMGWLNRMTQFKEKAGKDKEKASVGLYAYPVLMAADILLYDATHVPVGHDQKQHLELCRDIAQRFNSDFNVEDFLKVPEPLIQKNFSRIMSLKDGMKKMSKSDPSDLSRINLTDEKDLIVNKIKKAKTDNMPMPTIEENLEKRPEVENLLGIYSSLSNQTLDQSKKEFEEVIGSNDTDVVVAGMVGIAGLMPVHFAIQKGKKVLLANKESYVVAGEYLNNLCKETGATIFPIDSEHSAIHQCLNNEANKSGVSRIILTGSGGPFLNKDMEEFSSITPEQAINHPVWNMGKKISVDSSTLMNKGLEVIEARWFFDFENIEILIHPEGIIHS